MLGGNLHFGSLVERIWSTVSLLQVRNNMEEGMSEGSCTTHRSREQKNPRKRGQGTKAVLKLLPHDLLLPTKTDLLIALSALNSSVG